jgi:hypothetical protein
VERYSSIIVAPKDLALLITFEFLIILCKTGLKSDGPFESRIVSFEARRAANDGPNTVTGQAPLRAAVHDSTKVESVEI